MRLKSKLENWKLNSRLNGVSRIKRVFNLDSAQTAGILWKAGQEASFRQMEDELKGAGIASSGLCYFPQKKAVIPPEILGFTRKQASWWLEIPKAKVAEDFIQQKFDILIDLTGQNGFPMVFITALSNAAFKIGYAGNATNYFDWNIEFVEPPETSQLAQQILYYLQRINKKTLA